MKEHRQPVRSFLLPFPKCVICAPTCSGLRVAARPCSLPGRGGGAATRAVPVSFIRNIAVLRGKAQPQEPFTCRSAIQGFFPGISLGFFPLSRDASHQCFQKGVLFMTSLSFMECCHLFAIDPKTLRQWLTQARM